MKNFIQVTKTEEEQVEQVKKWVKENGMQIVTGIALGFAAIWGWGAYQNYQKDQSIQARTYYLSVVSSPENLSAFEELQNNYSDTDYADQASLMMAKHSVEQEKYKIALGYLTPLYDSGNDFVKHISRIRSANIYLQLGSYDDAISALDITNESEFEGVYSHTRGDIYLAKGDNNLAKQSYKKAIERTSSESDILNLIKIKLDDLN
ncbi:MAG: tetratricopeptide repeat protein [PS1 clade bacterium]|jgi:predicted negative regulator of RcsB-dependent stress response